MVADLLAGAGLAHLSGASIAFLAFSATVAGFVRGYSGFGFALAAMPLMTAVLVPREAIPVVLTFEVLLTLQFARTLKGDVAWATLRRLVVGMAAGTPFGVVLLGAIPPEPMRIALCLLLLLSVGVLWRPPTRSIRASAPLVTGTGVMSGLLSGGTAMSGPPIVLLFLATSDDAARSRATMMVFFLCSAALALSLGFGLGVFPVQAPVITTILVPFVAIGAIIGARCFAATGKRAYRKVALAILAVIAVFALGHSMAIPV
jgi:uncharacterized membrane protein YfcA